MSSPETEPLLWTEWLEHLSIPLEGPPAAEKLRRFDGFRLYPRERLLFEEDRRVLIGDRALDVLIMLVDHRGALVTKADLMCRIWGPVTVDDGALRYQITVLRKLLRDGQNGRRFILNVVGRGYVFVGDVR